MDIIEVKNIENIALRVIKANFKKKIGDTPTDALQMVNRKYVNLNGTITNRPIGSVATIGQQYFATNLNKPIFFDGTKWRDATSSIVASN